MQSGSITLTKEPSKITKYKPDNPIPERYGNTHVKEYLNKISTYYFYRVHMYLAEYHKRCVRDREDVEVTNVISRILECIDDMKYINHKLGLMNFKAVYLDDLNLSSNTSLEDIYSRYIDRVRAFDYKTDQRYQSILSMFDSETGSYYTKPVEGKSTFIQYRVKPTERNYEYETTIAEYNRKIDKLSNAYDKQKKEFETLGLARKEATDNYNTLLKKIKTMTIQDEELNKSIADIQKRLTELKRDTRTSSAEYNRLTTAIEKQTGIKKELENRIKEITVVLENGTKRMKNLETEIENKAEELRKKATELSDLNQQLENLEKTKFATETSYDQSIKEKMATINNLDSRITSLKNDLNMLDESIASKRSEHEMFINEIAKDKKQINNNALDLDTLLQKIKEAKEELSRLNNTKKSTRAELDDISGQLIDAANDLDQLSTSLDKAKADLDDINLGLNESERKLYNRNKELEILNGDIERKTIKLDSIYTALTTAENELNKLNNALEKTKDRLNETNDMLERATNELSNTQKNQNSIINNTIAAINDFISSKKKEITALTNEITEVNKQAKTTKEQYAETMGILKIINESKRLGELNAQAVKQGLIKTVTATIKNTKADHLLEAMQQLMLSETTGLNTRIDKMKSPELLASAIGAYNLLYILLHYYHNKTINVNTGKTIHSSAILLMLQEVANITDKDLKNIVDTYGIVPKDKIRFPPSNKGINFDKSPITPIELTTRLLSNLYDNIKNISGLLQK